MPASARFARTTALTTLRLSRMLSLAPAPINDRGDALDGDAWALLRAMRARGPFDPSRPVGAMRADYDQAGPILDVARRELARVEDLRIEGAAGPIGARLYVPRESREPMRGVVWLHGGGFVIGSLRSHDRALRALAADADAIVLAIDYRLGPEHRFPAAHDDAAAALRWALREAVALGIDRARLAIGGDSAGANLAASACIALRDAGERLPALQVLVYPPVDSLSPSESRRRLGDDFFLTTPLMEWFTTNHFGTRDLESPRVSLLRAELGGLPPAIVSPAGFDPLRDEGEALAAALAQASVRVERRPEPRLLHNWMLFGGAVPEAARALRGLAVAIRGALA